MAWIIAALYIRAAAKFDKLEHRVIEKAIGATAGSENAGGGVPIMSMPLVMFLFFCKRHAGDHLLGRAAHEWRERIFAANRQIKGWQNGFAVAGDYMSAASFLASRALSLSRVTTDSCTRLGGWSRT